MASSLVRLALVTKNITKTLSISSSKSSMMTKNIFQGSKILSIRSFASRVREEEQIEAVGDLTPPDVSAIIKNKLALFEEFTEISERIDLSQSKEAQFKIIDDYAKSKPSGATNKIVSDIKKNLEGYYKSMDAIKKNFQKETADIKQGGLLSDVRLD